MVDVLVSRIRSRSCSRSRSFVLVLNVAESAASYRTRHADICPGARHLPRTPRRARFGPDSDQTRTSTLTRMVDSTETRDTAAQTQARHSWRGNNEYNGRVFRLAAKISKSWISYYGASQTSSILRKTTASFKDAARHLPHLPGTPEWGQIRTGLHGPWTLRPGS